MQAQIKRCARTKSQVSAIIGARKIAFSKTSSQTRKKDKNTGNQKDRTKTKAATHHVKLCPLGIKEGKTELYLPLQFP